MVIWKANLSELKLPKAVIQEFIFGYPTLLQLGLADAKDSSELDSQFLHLKAVWNERKGLHIRIAGVPCLVQTYTLEMIRNGMLNEKRSLARFRWPPQPFTTTMLSRRTEF